MPGRIKRGTWGGSHLHNDEVSIRRRRADATGDTIASAQVQVGDNLEMKAGGLLTLGYAGNYGDQFQSSHGLNFGVDGTLTGSYYSPNFLSFDVTPYYNQSRANSNYQSLTGASGVSMRSANLFTGSHFPGSVSYRNDFNSTGTFGLTGQPDFTTHGHGQGFGIGWSALVAGPAHPFRQLLAGQRVRHGVRNRPADRF